MAKVCPVSGRSSSVGGGYSNRVRATKFNPTGKVRKSTNLQNKKFFLPSQNKTVKVTLTPRGIRTLKKQGVERGLRKAKLI